MNPLHDVEQDGAEARKAGYPASDNPYMEVGSFSYHTAWARGWNGARHRNQYRPQPHQPIALPAPEPRWHGWAIDAAACVILATLIGEVLVAARLYV